MSGAGAFEARIYSEDLGGGGGRFEIPLEIKSYSEEDKFLVVNAEQLNFVKHLAGRAGVDMRNVNMVRVDMAGVSSAKEAVDLADEATFLNFLFASSGYSR